MSDGTIIFDTKIDESGAKQGYSKLAKGYKAQLKELEKEIKNAQGYSDELRKKIEKGPNKSGFEKSLAKNEDYIKQLRSEWDSLNSKIESGGTGGNNGTPEIVPEDTGSSLDKLKTKLKESTARIRSFIFGGKETDNMAKKLSKSIFTLGNMFKLMAIRQAMRAAIAGAQSGFTNLIGYSNEAKNSVDGLKAATSSLSNGMAAAVAPIVNALAPSLVYLIGLLTDAANAVARFFAMITGAKTFVVAKKQASGLASSLGDVSSAAEKAKGSLAGIDEINDITVSSSGSGGGGGGAGYGNMFETVDTGPMTSAAEKVKALLDEMVQQSKNLKEAFAEAWAYNDNGSVILSDVKGILEDCYATTMEMATATTDWTENLNLVPLVSSVRGELDNLLPLIVTINDFISYIYTNGLLPIAGWVIESGLPAFIDVISAGLLLINSILQTMIPIVQPFYEVVIQPLASLLGGVIVSALEFIANVLTTIGTWMAANQPIMQAIFGVLVSIGGALALYLGYQSLILGVFDAFNKVSEAGKLFSDVLGVIMSNPILIFIAAVIAILILLAQHWDEVKAVAEDVWNSIEETYKSSPQWFQNMCNGIFSAFSWLVSFVSALVSGDWSKAVSMMQSLFQTFDNFLTGAFTQDWTVSFGLFGNLLNGLFATVNNIWGNIKQVFQGIIQFITGVFTGDWRMAWEGIKNIFGGIIGGIGNIFKAPLNVIIGGINGFIRGINRIKVPNWVPGVGGYGFHISQIPYLAKGTVVPPNAGEFMAVLGDNKRETEVVSPLSTMKKAMAEVMAEGGYGGSDDEVKILLRQLISVVAEKHLLVSDVGKAAAEYMNSEYDRTGEPVLKGV